MRSWALICTLSALLVLASAASGQAYMGLAWNQTVKEVLSDVAVGDVNGDGKNEVAVSGSSDGLVYLFDYEGKLLWTKDVGSYLNTVAVADINGDGKAEIITGHADMYFFDGAGTVLGRYNTQSGVFQIETGDLNGDGAKDIVAASYDKGECKDSILYAIDGKTRAEIWSYNAGKDLPFDYEVADVNGDGKLEVVLGMVYRAKGSKKNNGCDKVFNKESVITLLSSDGKLLWQKPTTSGVISLATGDANGDGKLEISIGGYSGLQLLSSEGNSLWQNSDIITSYVESVRMADLDNDNKSEVIAASNSVFAFSPEGKLIWRGITNSRAYSLVTADLDNDGKQEVIAGSGSLFVFGRNGQEMFRSPPHTSFGFVRAADLDADGKKEIVAGSVKNVFAYRTLEYATRLRADALFNEAVSISTTDPANAIEKFKIAKDVYRQLGQTDRVTECLNHITSISETTGRVGDLQEEANIALNTSQRLRSEGDLVNASRLAMSALDKYNAPQVNDRKGADEAKAMIEELKQTMHANAYQELVLANQTYHAGDFEGALRHSTKAEEYYDFIGELEMKQKAGLLSTSLRDLVGIKPQGATPPKQAASKIPDIGPYLEKFKKLNPLVAGGILVFVMVVFLLLVLSTYFWTLSKRRTLNVKELNRVSYGRRLGNDEQPESKPRPEATSATAQQPIQPSSRQAKTIERYATGANEVQTQIHKESIDSSAIKRRRPTVEKYKTGDETVGSNEDSSDDIFVKHTPNVSPFTVEPHALSTLNGKPSPNGAQRYSTTSEVGRIEFSPKSRLFDSTTIKEDKATQLSPNKGIMRIKVCRLGLCVKPKISRRGGLGRYSRRIN